MMLDVDLATIQLLATALYLRVLKSYCMLEIINFLPRFPVYGKLSLVLVCVLLESLAKLSFK